MPLLDKVDAQICMRLDAVGLEAQRGAVFGDRFVVLPLVSQDVGERIVRGTAAGANRYGSREEPQSLLGHLGASIGRPMKIPQFEVYPEVTGTQAPGPTQHLFGPVL